jgi:acetylornithine deacetylase/succinyl-diaminopimelate desuccinylase-like protein
MAQLMGLHVEILTDKKDSFNFAASLYPLHLNKPNIILLNHIDVVPAENPEKFKYPPFSGTIAEGQVWGRGAIDNKGMGVMQLLALDHFVERAFREDLPFNVTMISVSGEETGGYTGAKVVSEQFKQKLNGVVLFGEGGTGIPKLITNNQKKRVFTVSTTFKRSLWLKLTLKMNTSGHGSVPPSKYAVQEKIRALYKIVRWNRKVMFSKTTRLMFREIGRLEGGFKGLVLRNLGLFRPLAISAMRKNDIIYSLITNTITITGVNTPLGAPNIIPQEISVILDCRLLPEVETNDFLNEIIKVLDNKDVKIEIIQEDKMAKPSEIGHYYKKMEKALKAVFQGCDVIPILMPASNDNNYFSSLGMPAYGILPVFMTMDHIESIHNINERIPIESLEQGKRVYINLLNQCFE